MLHRAASLMQSGLCRIGMYNHHVDSAFLDITEVGVQLPQPYIAAAGIYINLSVIIKKE